MDLMSAEEKLAKCMLKLRTIRMFYSALYEALEKVPDGVDTIGVTSKQLLYKPGFIEATPFEELMFINLHEIAHVALMHVSRRGSRDENLWNIACDLYVNQALMKEFGLSHGTTATLNAGVNIRVPTDGMFCSSIDLKKDYVEKIYEELAAQGMENGYFSDIGRVTLGSEPEVTNTYHFHYVGSLEKPEYTFRKLDNWEFDYDLNITRYNGDICVNSSLDEATLTQECRQIVSDAMVRSELDNKAYGDNPGYIEREAKNLFKSVIDWRRLLNRYLTTTLSKDSSFSHPDKRMSYQPAIYPGLVSTDIGELSGIEICIDTSGSISEKELGTFLNQIETLAKSFKLSAEVLFWDAKVQSVGTIKTAKSITQIPVLGGGGTSPNCVFDYFEQNKIKPVVVLMLTDGIWSRDWVTPALSKKYRNTIWILTRQMVDNFDAPFGRKAQIKWEG